MVFPFAAIVGQEEMKLALLLNVIDPKIGGVMIMGDRGTGKSTTIRALADLLPEIDVVADDPFNSDPNDPDSMNDTGSAQPRSTAKKKVPMVDLPLGATEDRVCGTIDIEKALSEGVKAFEPGLLAKANRGILYVDEVNLLDDHLVDVLLDSAASGWNTGRTRRHFHSPPSAFCPSRFRQPRRRRTATPITRSLWDARRNPHCQRTSSTSGNSRATGRI
jgi:magnesium chelatase subunit I